MPVPAVAIGAALPIPDIGRIRHDQVEIARHRVQRVGQHIAGAEPGHARIDPRETQGGCVDVGHDNAGLGA